MPNCFETFQLCDMYQKLEITWVFETFPENGIQGFTLSQSSWSTPLKPHGDYIMDISGFLDFYLNLTSFRISRYSRYIHVHEFVV